MHLKNLFLRQQEEKPDPIACLPGIRGRYKGLVVETDRIPDLGALRWPVLNAQYGLSKEAVERSGFGLIQVRRDFTESEIQVLIDQAKNGGLHLRTIPSAERMQQMHRDQLWSGEDNNIVEIPQRTAVGVFVPGSASQYLLRFSDPQEFLPACHDAVNAVMQHSEKMKKHMFYEGNPGWHVPMPSIDLTDNENGRMRESWGRYHTAYLKGVQGCQGCRRIFQTMERWLSRKRPGVIGTVRCSPLTIAIIENEKILHSGWNPVLANGAWGYPESVRFVRKMTYDPAVIRPHSLTNSGRIAFSQNHV